MVRFAAAAALALLVGLVGGVTGVVHAGAAVGLLLVAVGVALWGAAQGKVRWGVMLAVLAILVALGVARGAAARAHAAKLIGRSAFGLVQVRGEVASLPSHTHRATHFTLRAVEVDGTALPAEARLRVFVAPVYDVAPGDRVVVRGDLVPSRLGGGEALLWREAAYGIVGVVRFGELLAREEGRGMPLLRLNAKLRERFGAYLPEPYAALLGGMLLGGRDALGAELEDAFVRAGLIHLVVLSGYNIAIVVAVLLLLVRAAPRMVGSVVAILAIAGVVAFAGAEGPAVRAGIMGGVAALGLSVGRSAHALAALMCAMLLIGLANPLALAYDASIHLSVAATAGVVAAASPIAQWISLAVPFRFISEALGATLAAQVAVTPLLWHIAGAVSVVALGANVLVAPFVPLVMLLGATLLGASFLSDAIASVLAVAVEVLLRWIVGVAHFWATMPWSTVTLPPLSWGGVALLYGSLLALGALVRYAARHICARRSMVSQLSAAQYASK